MAGTVIQEICTQICSETRAISRYSDAALDLGNETLRTIYAENRIDGLAHLQRLVVALTEEFGGEALVADTSTIDGCAPDPKNDTRADGFGDNNGDKRIIVECRDPDNHIFDLIAYLKDNANVGHSFNVDTDPDDGERKKFFFIDGDGPDFFYSVATAANNASGGGGNE